MPHNEMMTERMIRLAPVIVTFVTGAFLVASVPSPVLGGVLLVVTLIATALMWMRVRRPHH